MTDEKFQVSVLEEFKHLNTRIDGLASGLQSIQTQHDEMLSRVEHIETRLDETYAVVNAIDHSNQIGRAELDGQNIRIAKVEGKFRKAAIVFEEDIDVSMSSGF